MNRHLLFLVLLLSFGGFSASAQTVLLSNNFGIDAETQEEQVEGWVIDSMDSDGEDWFYAHVDDMGAPGFTGNLAVSLSFGMISGMPLNPENLYISPPTDLTGYNVANLNFRIGSMEMNNSSQSYKVLVVTMAQIMDPGFNLVDVTPIHTATLAGTNAGSVVTLSLSSYTGQPVFVIFQHSTSSGMGVLLLDDIELSAEFSTACQPANNLTASSVTMSGATISWTAPVTAPADGYEYYYNTSGVAPDNESDPTGSTGAGVTTLDLSPLGPAMTFYFWVRSKCGTDDLSSWSGPVSFITSCLPATGLTSSDIMANSATISWTASPSGPVEGYEYYVSTDSTTPNSETDATGATGAGITSTSIIVNPQTAYFVWVRSNCGDGVSEWTVSTSFTTPCNSMAIPTALQDFEGNVLPACWAGQTVQYAASWSITTPPVTDIETSHSGNNYIGLPHGQHNARLISPPLNYSAVTEPTMISLWLHRHLLAAPNDIYRVYVNTVPSITGASLVLEVYTRRTKVSPTSGTVETDGWHRHTPAIPESYHGSPIVYVIIAGTGTSMASYAQGIDDFRIMNLPNCAPITDLEAFSITTSGATIAWTAPLSAPAEGYQYSISETDTVPGSEAVTGSVAAGETSVEITTGLEQSHTYYVWVRSNCDDDGNVSPWGNYVSFTIPCSGAAVPSVNESFEDTMQVELSLYEMPACWDSDNDVWGVYLNDTQQPHTGSKSLMKPQFVAESLLFSAPYDYSSVSEDTRLNVWLRRDQNGDPAEDRYTVYVNTSPTLTDAVQILEIYSAISVDPIVEASGWYNYTPAIPSEFNGSSQVYIIVKGTTSFSGRPLGLDDFSVEYLPNCSPVENAVVSDITANSATISWTAPISSPADGYQYFVSPTDILVSQETEPTGSVPAGTTFVDLVLNPSTNYFVWVRSNCGDGDISDWSPVIAFTSICLPQTIPTAIETFETEGIPACWSTATVSGIKQWGITSGISGGILSSHSGTQRVQVPFGSFNALLYSPAMDYSAVTQNSKVNIWLHRAGSAINQDKYRIWVNTTTSMTGAVQILEVFTSINGAPVVATEGWYNYNAAIPNSFNGAAEVYIIIQGIGTDNSSYSTAIDDFMIEMCDTPIPSAAGEQSFCGAVTIADIDITGSNITWYSEEQGGNILSAETSLSTATSYYATQTIAGCESERVEVMVQVSVTPAPIVKL